MMIHNRDDEVIIAQCTPSGSGALALIRLSGDTALDIATAISKLGQGKKINQVPSHTIHFGWVVDQEGKKVDQVMFSVMHAPRTFTGQPVVEITCHNNQYIIEDIIACAIRSGARPAQKGEFSQRAFLQGKIDLVQAEALNDLIHAQTQYALKKSLAQLEGTFSHWIMSLEQQLIKALAWCEASFEFLDEEEEFGSQIKDLLAGLLIQIQKNKKTFDLHQHIRQGIRIALIGSVNVGKSSLLNMLVGKNRSIVTSVAGTTRDTIEAGIDRNGIHWTLIDTAGIRSTDNTIEQEGIHRSLKEAQTADIILLIFDGSRAFEHEEKVFYNRVLNDYPHKVILVHNKADLGTHPDSLTLCSAETPLTISTLTQADNNLIEQAIDQKISFLLEHVHEVPFVLNKRQYTLLLGLENKLTAILGMLSVPIHYELISYQLRNALEHITELTGKSISEAGLDTVFREFCVGK